MSVSAKQAIEAIGPYVKRVCELVGIPDAVANTQEAFDTVVETLAEASIAEVVRLSEQLEGEDRGLLLSVYGIIIQMKFAGINAAPSPVKVVGVNFSQRQLRAIDSGRIVVARLLGALTEQAFDSLLPPTDVLAPILAAQPDIAFAPLLPVLASAVEAEFLTEADMQCIIDGLAAVRTEPPEKGPHLSLVPAQADEKTWNDLEAEAAATKAAETLTAEQMDAETAKTEPPPTQERLS